MKGGTERENRGIIEGSGKSRKREVGDKDRRNEKEKDRRGRRRGKRYRENQIEKIER